MSFADELNKKITKDKNIDYHYNSIASSKDYMKYINNDIRRRSELHYKERKLEGYIVIRGVSDPYSDSVGLDFYEDIPDPFPNKIKEVWTSDILKITEKHKKRICYGIYDPVQAKIFRDKLSKELKDLGFYNIEVNLESVEMKKVISVRKNFWDSSSYKVSYEKNGEIGNKIYASFEW